MPKFTKDEFKALTLDEVAEKAAVEPLPKQGEPQFLGRPWSQLHGEMLAAGAETVGELDTPQGAQQRWEIFYTSTGSHYADTASALGLDLGSAESTDDSN